MKRTFVALMGALFLIASIDAVGEELRPAPAELVRLGKQLGCLVPRPERDSMAAAWVMEREAGLAYAAWCERQSSGESVYDLVVSATSEHPWSRCPALIRIGIGKPFPHFGIRMLPRDLPYAIDLGEFWYLRGDDYVIQGPPVRGSGPPRGPALDIGVGDAGQILVCFGGSWIMGGYH